MNNHKRKARTLSIWSAGLLLAAVAAYLDGFTGAAWTAALPFVATTLVVASAATAMGAVASGSRPMNGGKRTVLLWSSGALTLELAVFVIAWGLETTAVSAACDGGAYPGSAEGCAYAYAYLLVGFGGLVASAALIALLGAVVAGLINAGQRGEHWWFAAILTALLGAVAVVGWDALVLGRPQLEGYSSLESVQGWLIPVAPLLVAMLTLLFSLVGARQPARS